METGIKPTLVRYDGIYADEHSLDAEQLGYSLVGLSKASNIITHFYLHGEITNRPNSFNVRYFARPPSSGSLTLEIFAQMQNAQLPMFTGALLAHGDSIISALWNIVIEGILGRNTNMEKALEKIDSIHARESELNRAMLKQIEKMNEQKHSYTEWLQTKVDDLISATRAPMRQLPAPVGKSCKTQTVWDGAMIPTKIDEPDAEVLRSKGEITVENQRTFNATRITALNDKTCVGAAALEDDLENPVPLKITDPVLSQVHNIYAKSYYDRVPIILTGKPTYKDGQLHKIFVSDAKLQ